MSYRRQLKSKPSTTTPPTIPPGSYGFRSTLYEKGWKPWEVMRLLVEYPQEARLMAIEWEETALHQAKEDAKSRKENGGGAGSRPTGQLRAEGAGAGGTFEAVERIGGDDDEVDWKDALESGD